ELQAANLRLDRKIALRVAPGHAAYFVSPNWYQIASDYSGADAIVASKDQPMGTGFIIRGSSLYGPWGAEPVFVTAFHVVGSEVSDPSQLGLRPAEAQATFPGLREKDDPIKFGAILWQRPIQEQGVKKQGITVLRIKGALPFGARPIEKVRIQEFE